MHFDCHNGNCFKFYIPLTAHFVRRIWCGSRLEGYLTFLAFVYEYNGPPGTRYRVWYTNESLSIIVHFPCHHHATFCNAQFIFITSSLCSSIVGLTRNKAGSATPFTNAIKRATYLGTAFHLSLFDGNAPSFYAFIYPYNDEGYQKNK